MALLLGRGAAYEREQKMKAVVVAFVPEERVLPG
jgi:hypothetical protein